MNNAIILSLVITPLEFVEGLVSVEDKNALSTSLSKFGVAILPTLVFVVDATENISCKGSILLVEVGFIEVAVFIGVTVAVGIGNEGSSTIVLILV